MRFGIKHKLFFTLFATSGIVVAAMYFFMQWSFHRGFLDYVNSQDLQSMAPLAENLLNVYKTDGGWQTLRGNRARWRKLLANSHSRSGGTGGNRNALPPGPEAPRAIAGHAKDPLHIGPRTMLLNADKTWVIGIAHPRSIAGRKMNIKPLVIGGKTVGYLAIVAMKKLTASEDRRFAARQTRIFGMISLAMILVSMLLGFPLIYHLMVPIKAMTLGAEKLTSGDYTVRIPVTTGDELARLSEHFNLLAATLERNEKSRRRYMADVSHDLRTPLAILLGEIEAVQDGVREVEPTLAVLHEEVQHLNRLVGDLHELSLSDLGALSYRKHWIDPVIALEQAIELFRPRMAASGITLSAQLPEEEDLALHADPHRIQQLFTNLLENSLRYTDPGGRVEVALRRAGQALKVEIRDSAPGVSDEERGKLFARLYRVETSRNRANGGSGLGLAICWNIVEAHQGRIQAHPSPLGGLLIEITLPLSRKETSA